MNHGDGDICLLLPQGRFKIGSAQFLESQPELGKLISESIKNIREMIGQGSRRGGKSKVLVLFALESLGHLVEPRKKGVNEVVEFFAWRGERERASMKQLHTEILFQLENLAADCRLLDSIGHLANRFSDSFELCDEVEELEVVYIHIPLDCLRVTGVS